MIEFNLRNSSQIVKKILMLSKIALTRLKDQLITPIWTILKIVLLRELKSLSILGNSKDEGIVKMLEVDTSKYYIQTSYVWNDEESPLVRILSCEKINDSKDYRIIHLHLGKDKPVRLILSELELPYYFRPATDEEIIEQLLKWGI